MASNIFQRTVTPLKPRILSEERVFVYTPVATYDTAGIASFTDKDFIINNGKVSLTWPMEYEINSLTDPINSLSRIHVSKEEFIPWTGEKVVITNKAGQSFETDKGSVLLNRTERKAFERPDFVMLSDHEFVQNTNSDGYNVYTFNLNNDHYNEKTFVQVDRQDFYDNVEGTGIVKVNWPKAHDKSGSRNADGYGLVKIAENSVGYLKYSQNGLLEVDYQHLIDSDGLQVIPTYSGNEATGFTNKREYVDNRGRATKTDTGSIKLAITKDAVGLSRVENKAFSEYKYSDFSEEMKQHFTEEYDKKLDKVVWDDLFTDWKAPSAELRTPQLRLDYLTKRDEAQQEQIDTLFKAKLFLGYFMDEAALNKAYPPKDGAVWFGCYAFLYSTNTYWVINGTSEENYKWVDTGFKILSYMDHIEDDVNALRPDGVPSIGTTGKWIQSDHVHPTDETRLSKELYKSTSIDIISEYLDDDNDFIVNLWNEDMAGNYIPHAMMNVPYIRKSRVLHNWKNANGIFKDSEESEEKYWAGDAESYGLEVDKFDNNTIFFVDDGENATIESFLTEEELRQAGITIDVYHQTDKIPSFDVRQLSDIEGSVLTLESVVEGDTNKYRIKPLSIPNLRITEDTPIESGQMLVKVKDGDKTTLGIRQFEASDTNKLLSIDGNGRPVTVDIDNRNLIKANSGSTVTTLTSGQIVIAGENNSVTTFATGTKEGRVLVSDGSNGVKGMAAFMLNTPIVGGPNGSLSSGGYVLDNTVITSDSMSKTTLEAGIIAVDTLHSGNRGNVVKSIGLGELANVPVVSDGSGALRAYNYPPAADKLLMLRDNGQLSYLSMTAGDADKVVSVDSYGKPTLKNVTVPSELPAKYTTVKPTADNTNANSIIIVKTDAAVPWAELKEGYLYLW